MENSEYSTKDLENQAINIDDVDDFVKEMLPILKKQKEAWTDKINQIIVENDYSIASFAKVCEVSHTAVAKWCKGAVPQSRELFIKIGFAAHYNIEEMNFFLCRYGKYSKLYAKSLEDSVCIFVLNSPNFKHEYSEYKQLMYKVKQQVINERAVNREYETEAALKSLLDIETTDEFENFLSENVDMYKQAFNKFYDYVEAFIILNNQEFAVNRKRSINSLAMSQGWSSSLRHCVYDICKHEWFPMRRKVIALGLHLNMDVEQINTMLITAKMETLCAKNPVECAIIFAVEDASLNDDIYCDGGMELCDHVKNVLQRINLQEAADLVNDI